MRLRVKDIDFAHRQIEMRDSKGGKSRVVPMPENLVEPLERWVASREVLHRHDLHKDTFPKRLRHAVDAAGLNKRVTSHTFRHCFATHHLWQGTNIREIQQWLVASG